MSTENPHQKEMLLYGAGGAPWPSVKPLVAKHIYHKFKKIVSVNTWSILEIYNCICIVVSGYD